MRIRILIAAEDADYLDRLARVVTDKYADLFEVNVCSSKENLRQVQQKGNADIALIGAEFMDCIDFGRVRMPILMWDGEVDVSQADEKLKLVKKYQRISSIVSKVLEYYSVLPKAALMVEGGAPITVVWSPAGGCGKTTVALAYAAQKAAAGKKVVYLDFEPFSSGDVYFSGTGKSISCVFERLDTNLELLLQSVQMQDPGSGIYYFSKPDNYDDMNELTAEDMCTLVSACAKNCDEVIVDCGGACGTQTKALLDMAASVMLVVTGEPYCQKKWEQFCTQYSVFESIREKAMMVKNRGAGNIAEHGMERIIELPKVQSADPVIVYKTLSGGYFS